MFNRGMIKQAQQLQKKLAETSAKLEREECETSAGGGLVKAKVNGRQRIVSLTIAPEALTMGDPELLADAITSAVNSGLDELKQKSDVAMQKLTGGFPMPF